MLIDNLLHDRQSKPRALFAHRDIGLENSISILDRQSLAIVDNVDHVIAARILGCLYQYPATVTFLFRADRVHRLSCILDEIAKSLSQHA